MPGRGSMQRKITLRVLGVSLDDEQTVSSIATHLDDLVWSAVDACVHATVIADNSCDLVSQTIEAARRIEHNVPDAHVDRVDEELVGVSDIAARVGLNRETIRSWATGSRGPGSFPRPVGSVGGGDRGATKIWRWADVNAWLDNYYSLGDNYSYASNAELAEINAYLAGVKSMVVALVNGPTTLPGVSYTRNIDSRANKTYTITSKDPVETNYLLTNQSIRA